MRWILLVIVSLGFVTAPLAAQEDVDVQALIAECEACHGPGGRSDTAGIPGLAGRPVDDLVENLEQFYHYERHCPERKTVHGASAGQTVNMCHLVNTLSPEERRALAEYFHDSS